MNSLKNEISKRSAYYISKHRYLELKHFCLQYPEWKRCIANRNYIHSDSLIKLSKGQVEFKDPTADIAKDICWCEERIKVVEDACMAADPELYGYLLEAITKDESYDSMRSRIGVPCGRRQFYERYRKVFWILDICLKK